MSKKNMVLLLVFLAIFSIILLNRESMRRQISTDMEREQARLFDESAPEFVIIEINDLEKNQKVTLEKRDTKWFVKEKGCPADEHSVNRVLSTLPKIRLGQRVSDWRPDFMKVYGFDKGLEISAGGKTFMLGGMRETRIALKVENDLYLSPFREKFVFTKHDGNWCREVEEPEISDSDQTEPEIKE